MASSVVLVGMPSVGKSTVGVLLAKALSKGFIDSDIVLQTHIGCSLQTFLDRFGYLALRQKEEETLLTIPLADTVVATGGSAVYSDKAMKRLSCSATVVYLEASLASISARMTNFSERGIAAPEGVSLEDIYEERHPLYQHYADITLNTDNHIVSTTIEQVLSEL